jgi:hypothetical protein
MMYYRISTNATTGLIRLSPMIRPVTLHTTKSDTARAAAPRTGSLPLSVRSFLYFRDKNTRQSNKEANTSQKSRTGAISAPGATDSIADWLTVYAG